MGWRRVIAHVDIDCFFAQIALLDRPELRDLPIAVAHGGAHSPQPARNAASLDADNDDDANEYEGFGDAAASSSADRGNSEISSANYIARRSGIRAGMFVSSAMSLCPGLVVLPYDFERSRVVTRILYSTLLDLSPRVQALSCDEAFVDLSHAVDPLGLLRSMRSSFHKATGCTLSVGVGQSLLVARLATRRAKPDGLAYLPSEGASLTEVLAPLPIEELPGVGPRATSALNEIGIVNIGDALAASRATLVSALGNTAALAFINAAQGHDDREVITLPPPPKSVGVQMNYGIRLANVADTERVLSGLASELARRLRAAGEEEADLAGRERSAAGGHIRCKSLTLKVLIRRPGAGEPRKFNGHGIVDSMSRSMRPRKPMHESIDIAQSAYGLLSALKLDPRELRGLGLIAGDLERPAERSIGSVLRDMTHHNAVVESDDIIEVKDGSLPQRGAARRAGVFSSWIREGSRPVKLAKSSLAPQAATVLDSDEDGVVIIDQEASSAPQRLVPCAERAETLHAWLLRSLQSDPSGKRLEQEAVSALTKRDGMNADDVVVFLRTLSRVGGGELAEPRMHITLSLLSAAREKFGFSIMWN
jgi:DNA repair protein REV1